MDAIVEKHGDSIVFADVQRGSSTYGSSSGDLIASTLKMATYTPSFWGMGDTISFYDADENNIVAEYGTFKSKGVTANIAFQSSISGNTLTVKTQTKFFKDVNEDYYVNIIIMESGFEAQQSGAPGGKVIAARVVRKIFSGEDGAGDVKFWNTQVASASTSAGVIVENTFSTTLDNSWNKSNLSYIATIWTGRRGTVKSVNSEDVPSEFVSIHKSPFNINKKSLELKELNGVLKFKSPFSKKFEAKILNLKGETIHSFSKDNSKTWHSIPYINVTGLYILQITSEGNSISRKFEFLK